MGRKRTIFKIIAVLCAAASWEIAALAVNSKLLLASPIRVAQRLFEILKGGGFLSPVWFSFSRIVFGFLSALLLGTLFAALAGKFFIAEALFWPYMVTIKSVPVASFIVLALIWFSSSTLSSFTAFLMALPVIYTNVLSGIKSVDIKMTQAADVFKTGWLRRLIYIWLPAVKPFLISGCMVALGLSWKAGIAAEIIGIPEGSLGERLYYAKVYLNSGDLLAWTVVIVILSVAFEKLFVFLLKQAFKAVEKHA